MGGELFSIYKSKIMEDSVLSPYNSGTTLS